MVSVQNLQTRQYGRDEKLFIIHTNIVFKDVYCIINCHVFIIEIIVCIVR